MMLFLLLLDLCIVDFGDFIFEFMLPGDFFTDFPILILLHFNYHFQILSQYCWHNSNRCTVNFSKQQKQLRFQLCFILLFKLDNYNKQIHMTCKLSVKHQIKKIFESICYRAFGQKIQANIKYTDKSQYEVTIARDLYQTYADSNFRYCTQGTTPKTLAEEMEIHLLRQQQILTDINQFGIFQVKLHKSYKEQLLNTIKSEQYYKFVSLQELVTNARKAFEVKHCKFIYHFRPKMFLRDYRLIYYTQCMAKIKANIENHHVDRIFLKQNAQNIFYEEMINQTSTLNINQQNLLKEAKSFLKQEEGKLKLQQIDNKTYCNYIGVRNGLIETQSTSLLQQAQYRTNCQLNLYLNPQNHFLACYRQLQTPFEISYPHVKLIKVGNIKQNISLNWQKIHEMQNYNKLFLMTKTEDFIDKCYIESLINKRKEEQQIKFYENLDLGDKAVLFGDYLGDYNFVQAYYLMKAMNKYHYNNQVVNAINHTFKHLFSV